MIYNSLNAKLYCARVLPAVTIILYSYAACAQTTPAPLHYKIIAAGSEYNKSKFYQWLWGRNRRIEWTTPVNAPSLWLDTALGGLRPYKTGGGNETKTLHLRSENGKLYSLRSINKSRKDVIQKEFENTFIADIIKDGISMSYPYGAFAVTGMEQQSGIYHTKPQLVYLPTQPALDSLNNKFGDDLYLFEEKPDSNWSNEDNLGNFTDFIATDDLVKAITKNNLNKADQYAYLKARLFDILIGDWDRHEGQWEWGRKDTLHFLYQAVPKDRDQAFYTHNGFLINKILPAAGLGFMENFTGKPGEMKRLNTEQKNIDRFFTNALSYEDWIKVADDLEHSLTDSVIYNSVMQLPPEIFDISGHELIEKLISRRKYIHAYASEYYHFIARQADVTGSEKPEYFSIRSAGNKTSVSVYRFDDIVKADTPYYSRTFTATETKTVYIYGIDGKDVFHIDGDNSIQIYIIGGEKKDSVIQTGRGNVFVYDNKNNVFITASAKLRLSEDTSVHEYKYDWYRYNKESLVPSVFYTNEDRFYVGLGYGFQNYKWRRDSFASKQLIDVHYSLSQNAFSTTYTAAFPNIIRKWSLNILASYDAIRWTNFYGLGNTTQRITTDKSYYRMRSREWLLSAGLQKQFGRNTFTASGFFKSVDVLQDTERFASKVYANTRDDIFTKNNYGGADVRYTYIYLNDSVVPVKGITLLADAVYAYNLTEKDPFEKFAAQFQGYLPLAGKFSLAIKAGAATVIADNEDIVGSARFYEHVVIGGPDNFRGYTRERFWGKTSMYNNNELRFITDLHTHLLNAKFGVLAFFDDGRVWMPGEVSHTLHTSYGGGILLSPFYKIFAAVTYGISKDGNLLQVRVNINKLL